MKANIKRYTERDEYGNADIIGVDSADLQLNLEFEECNKVTKALNRLAELEDKLEQGTLIEKPNNIIELMAEFILSTQEGYCLTCDNPMRNVNIRRQGSQGCDGNCQHYREYTKDDIIEMFECECQLEKEKP